MLDEEFDADVFEIEPPQEGEKGVTMEFYDKFRLSYDLLMPITEHEELGK
jgi:hypothetical protein